MDECGNCAGQPNMGLTTCASVIAKSVGKYYVPRFDNDGNLNKIPLTGITPGTLIDLDSYISNPDPSKRWYPLQDILNVKIDKADPDYKTYDNKAKEKIQDGIYSGSFEKGFGVPAGLVGNIDRISCREWSEFNVTEDEAIFGEFIDGDLYPILLRAFDVKGKFADDASQAGAMITYDYDKKFQYGRLRQLTRANLNADPTTVTGLRNVNIEVVSCAAAVAVLKLTSDYGSNYNVQDIDGLIDSDFAILNKTTNLAVPVLTSTEAPEVSYSLTYAAQTVTDVLEFTVVINAKKYTGVITGTVA